MFDLFGKRTTPLSVERWVKRQIWLTIGVFIIAGLLATIAGFVPFFIEPTFYFGIFFIVTAFLINIIFLRFSVKDFHDHYVATFKSDKSIAISQRVIRVSYFRDIGLVIGVFLILLGLFFTFISPSSLRQQDTFGDTPAPAGYTWVVFNPPNEIPEGRELVLQTGRETAEYFFAERFLQGRVGFLVPERYLNMRNLTVLFYEPEDEDDD